MSARIYARINKDTLRFIRNTKQVSFDYIERIAKYSKDRIEEWEDSASNKLPTINQAKGLAKCYRVPFAGFYMNSVDINVNHLPAIINKRTMLGASEDDSAVNLAVIDLLNAREFFLETKEILRETIPTFNLHISEGLSASEWARIIRKHLDLDLEEQYKIGSKRKFYLYLRRRVEENGIFVQGFEKVDVGTLRGVAIVDNKMPIIGINDEDRYPARSFTIIHEIVHVIKRTSAICNDMYGFTPWDGEEVFCNAVAGETLVPRSALIFVCKKYSNYSIDEVEAIANKFSVSLEVIARRLYDTGICDKLWYIKMSDNLSRKYEAERDSMREAIKLGLSDGPKRNMSREAVDRNSTAMCDILLRGYSEGLFDKADISAHIGIGQKHINKFMSEVIGWYRK